MRLPELRTGDLRRIAHFTRGLYEATDSCDWEERFHAGIRDLVDGDVSVWNEIEVEEHTILNASAWPTYDAQFWRRWVPDLLANLQAHPVVVHLRRARLDSMALRLSDWPDQKQIDHLPLFQEIYARWDWRRMCIGTIQAEGSRYYWFQVCRSRGDFSTRDVQRFQAILDHCQQARWNLERRDRLKRALLALRAGAGRTERFWVFLNPYLCITSESPNAKRILRAALPHPCRNLFLPEELRTCLIHHRTIWEMEKTPLARRVARFVMGEHGKAIDFIFRADANGGGHLCGATRGAGAAGGDTPLDGSGAARILTRRESETLRWLLAGKTNPEIAILLGVRPKTIEKHVSAILAKLALRSRQDLIRQLGGGRLEGAVNPGRRA